MITGEGVLAQIENVQKIITYKPITQQDIVNVVNKLQSVKPKPVEMFISLGGLGNLLFKLRFEYLDYSYNYVYHKRIKVYEFRFYKKYKQNVEFREYYNEKYEKVNYGRKGNDVSTITK